AGPWASTAAGLSIRVDKRVPVAGGMAGGSADAAAALVACNELWELGLGADQLETIGRTLGADVPACLAGGIALGTGRGDHMSVLRKGDEAGAQHHWVMLLAREGLSTPSVFREFDRIDAEQAPALVTPSPEEVAALCAGPEELRHCLVNDLQAPALRLRPELAETIAAATDAGALAVTLSGSGPTVAALARDAEHAHTLAATLSDAPTVARAIPAHGPACGARIESTEAI
ncbi:4-(cytidine 5'-diphospho)-2-C-methyl-D-erythritol kinase, partial [uncultured Actinomyces sp.]|uniref:GHMP family kinase ATP-binding protein n=1 Tax=uncultured Actinomyces sp. TaxID=249061 RepID=UPI0028EAFB69